MHALLLCQLFASFLVNRSCLGQVWPERQHVVCWCSSGFEENARPVEIIPYLWLLVVSDSSHTLSPLCEQLKPSCFKVQARSWLCCLISYPAFSSPHFPHGFLQTASLTTWSILQPAGWSTVRTWSIFGMKYSTLPDFSWNNGISLNTYEFWRGCSASHLPDWLTIPLAYLSNKLKCFYESKSEKKVMLQPWSFSLQNCLRHLAWGPNPKVTDSLK